ASPAHRQEAARGGADERGELRLERGEEHVSAQRHVGHGRGTLGTGAWPVNPTAAPDGAMVPGTDPRPGPHAAHPDSPRRCHRDSSSARTRSYSATRSFGRTTSW